MRKLYDGIQAVHFNERIPVTKELTVEVEATDFGGEQVAPMHATRLRLLLKLGVDSYIPDTGTDNTKLVAKLLTDVKKQLCYDLGTNALRRMYELERHVMAASFDPKANELFEALRRELEP